MKLPGDDIVVVHRSDGSGTTYIWTDFLSKVSPDWKSKIGTATSVNWPTGIGGKGSDGVAGLVKQTPDSIGYIELIFALQNHISYGAVQNASGKFLKADLAGVTAAASASAKDIPDDFSRVSITNAPGAAAYPDLELHLAPDSDSQIPDAAKRDAIKGLPEAWMLADGQGLQRGSVLRKASTGRSDQGKGCHRNDQVVGAQLRPGKSQCPQPLLLWITRLRLNRGRVLLFIVCATAMKRPT